MSLAGQTAYLTGGASGLGKATAEMLVKKGIKVFIADINPTGAEAVCHELNGNSTPASKPDSNSVQNIMAQSCGVDTSDWNSQAKAFTQAVTALGGRIDYVYPIAGIGEQMWLPLEDHNPNSGFEMPDLGVLDVNLRGVLYTVALAVQQFRRQGVNEKTGYAGKIGCVVSVCGIYTIPTLPIYNAAKHGLAGFIRSYGKHLVLEKITLNGTVLPLPFASRASACLNDPSLLSWRSHGGVLPNVVRTQISTPEFYEFLERKKLLTPLNAVPDTFEALLDSNEDDMKDTSGELFEVGPNYGKNGQKWVHWKGGAEYLDPESEKLCDLIHERTKRLHVLGYEPKYE